jgi:hypothetical protein
MDARGVTWSNGEAQGALAPTQVAPAATGVNRGAVGRSTDPRGIMNRPGYGGRGSNSVMGALAAQFSGLAPLSRGGRRHRHKKTRKARKNKKTRKHR